MDNTENKNHLEDVQSPDNKSTRGQGAEKDEEPGKHTPGGFTTNQGATARPKKPEGREKKPEGREKKQAGHKKLKENDKNNE